jgi:hypothetical protein
VPRCPAFTPAAAYSECWPRIARKAMPGNLEALSRQEALLDAELSHLKVTCLHGITDPVQTDGASCVHVCRRSKRHDHGLLPRSSPTSPLKHPSGTQQFGWSAVFVSCHRTLARRSALLTDCVSNLCVRFRPCNPDMPISERTTRKAGTSRKKELRRRFVWRRLQASPQPHPRSHCTHTHARTR